MANTYAANRVVVGVGNLNDSQARLALIELASAVVEGEAPEVLVKLLRGWELVDEEGGV